VTNATPPGWYPDPWKQAAQRFWDGAQWTHRVSGGTARVERPRLPDGAPVYGALIWILALLPVLNGITVWFIHLDPTQFSEFLREVRQASESGRDPSTVAPDFNVLSLYGPTYWVAAAVGWAGFITAIVLAYFDWRRLGRLGVVRPFHWSWAFLTTAVYVIGRSVIVRKVAAPRGLVPVWLLIGAYVAALISAGIWGALLVGDIARQLNGTFTGV